MNDFDEAISIVDKYQKYITFFLAKLIPGLAGGIALANGAGFKCILFMFVGFVFGIVHFLITEALVKADVGEDAESLWKYRIFLIGCYFFGLPVVFLYYCNQFSVGLVS
jgi:hypothetical protein